MRALSSGLGVLMMSEVVEEMESKKMGNALGNNGKPKTVCTGKNKLNITQAKDEISVIWWCT